jgi:hypothetical protein
MGSAQLDSMVSDYVDKVGLKVKVNEEDLLA